MALLVNRNESCLKNGKGEWMDLNLVFIPKSDLSCTPNPPGKVWGVHLYTNPEKVRAAVCLLKARVLQLSECCQNPGCHTGLYLWSWQYSSVDGRMDISVQLGIRAQSTCGVVTNSIAAGFSFSVYSCSLSVTSILKSEFSQFQRIYETPVLHTHTVNCLKIYKCCYKSSLNKFKLKISEQKIF